MIFYGICDLTLGWIKNSLLEISIEKIKSEHVQFARVSASDIR